LENIRKIISQECLEHVRYGKGNLVYRTFTGCYDEDTKILTKKGWIPFRILTTNDKVACLSKNNEMYWHNPSVIQKFYYKGKMIKMSHSSHDLLVTPVHNMFLRKQDKKEFEFIKAKDCDLYYYDVLNTVDWKGKEVEYFKCGKEKYYMDDFLEFLGLYISDGFVNSNEKFYFSSIDLHNYLKKIDKSLDKYIPQEFMDLSKRQLKILFDSLMKGNGSINNQTPFYTNSKKLRDNFQELCIKIGYNSTTKFRNRKSKIDDRIKQDKNYEITITKNKFHGVGKRFKSFSEENYDGMVYCCTVPEHVICVKRNGKITWCGNSGKTTTVLKTLYESKDGFSWMYFAPYHKVIQENMELSKVIDFSNDWIHLLSRRHLCLSKEYKELSKHGVNIQPFCENFCTLKDTRCPYYENLRKLREYPYCFAGVHAHIPTLLQKILYEKWKGRPFFSYYDVIVIDEFPYNSIYSQVSLGRKDITKQIDTLDLMELDGKLEHVIRYLLERMLIAVDSAKGLDHDDLKRVLVEARGLNVDTYKETYDLQMLELVRRKKIKSPPEDILHYILEIIKRQPSRDKLEWVIHKTVETVWHKSRLYLTISNIPYFKNLPVKVIALDGTADLPVWKSVLGDDCTAITFDLQYKNVYQMIGARNPTSTIVKSGELSSSGLRLYELLKRICEYKKRKYKVSGYKVKEVNVLICCSYRIQQLLKKKFKKDKITNFEFATFYKLRSRNSYYEYCDTCVLFHEPNIPPFQTEIIKNVLNFDYDTIRLIHREDEMKQGIGRLRQNIPVTPQGRKREKLREIFIFSSTGYKKLFPDARYMRYGDMLSYVSGGKKRLYFDTIRNFITEHTPISKTKLGKHLDLSYSKVNRLVSILEKEGDVKVEWGKITWIKKPTLEDEERYLIKIGGVTW